MPYSLRRCPVIFRVLVSRASAADGGCPAGRVNLDRDGRIEFDGNTVERSIRLIAFDCKTELFVGSDVRPYVRLGVFGGGGRPTLCLRGLLGVAEPILITGGNTVLRSDDCWAVIASLLDTCKIFSASVSPQP